MWGAVIGDIIGSAYEFHNVKIKDFPLWRPESRFTDDSVCTMAIADAMMNNTPFDVSLKKWGRNYLAAGYGKSFYGWMMSDTSTPYKSYANGAIMRLSPVGFLAKDRIHALLAGFEATGVTHNTPEALVATEAYIDTMFGLKNKTDPKIIRESLSAKFGYNMDRSVDEIRENYNQFYVRCSKSVPEAIICALEGKDFEDTIRNAVSLGGDSDTIAAMAGALAEIRFGVPPELKAKAQNYLPQDMQDILTKMYAFPKTITRQKLSYHPITGAREYS